MLKNADFKPVYATGEDEPIEFYLEGLLNSVKLDIGLGFFSSSAINTLAIGFAYFIKRGGVLRLLINDFLSTQDKNAILHGQSGVHIDVEERVINDILKLKDTLSKRDEHFFKCLSWLIANDRIQIQALVPRHSKKGIVHQKFGLFTDIANDIVAFTGSTNLSKTALQYNVEDLCCDFSWNESSFILERIEKFQSIFERAWNGTHPSVQTIPIDRIKATVSELFPSGSLDQLADEEYDLAAVLFKDDDLSDNLKAKLKILLDELGNDRTKETSQEQDNKKWQHQDIAIDLFKTNMRGILNMATGTGKTKTALRIVVDLVNSKEIETVIISCDGVDLLNQWYKELLNVVRNGLKGWLIFRHYSEHHDSDKFRNNPLRKILLVSRQQLHLGLFELPDHVASKTLLIHDEVHKLGSAGNIARLSGLSDNIKYRLGLSATPDREYDAEGTQFIIDHIGPVLFEFGLEDAIRRGILAPFNYIQLPYDLTNDDRLRLRGVYSRKAARENAGNPMSDTEFWIELSKVYKTSEGKIPVFRDFIHRRPDILLSCIIFVETKEYGLEILNLVHELSTDFHTYFGEDDDSELERFSRGEIKCLLTCHRLSEGIDIRSLQNVILLSSARARLETIQRIGRCLRSDPSNPSKIANVVDFVRRVEEEEDEDAEQNSDTERAEFLNNLSLIRPD